MSTAPPDVEATSDEGNDKYDPFKERRVAHPTTDVDTLIHVMKSSLGTGILAMPLAFKYTGLTVGVLGTIFVAAMCTHCAYILVKCAHALYHRTKVPAMSFEDVGEVAFATGPPFCRKFSKVCRYTIVFGLFLTYFGTCSVYTVIIANSLQQIIQHSSGGTVLNIRLVILILLVPMILISWVPNLKYLTPFSMIANLLMVVGLSITFYFLFTDIPDIGQRYQATSITTLPQFLSIVIFAMECIGTIMPFENNMKHPTHFLGLAGVLDQGMAVVTAIYMFLGFMGYWRYGEDIEDVITLSLPKDDVLALTVKGLIGLAVYCTYPLVLYVCIESGLKWFSRFFLRRPRQGQYIIRTSLAAATVLLAIALPTIGPFIGLIGATFFSITGLIVPALIECATFWEVAGGLGRYNWLLWKNVFVVTFGVVALVSGTFTSIASIVAMYST